MSTVEFQKINSISSAITSPEVGDVYRDRNDSETFVITALSAEGDVYFMLYEDGTTMSEDFAIFETMESWELIAKGAQVKVTY